MMQLRNYESSDYPELCSWLIQRELKIWDWNYLPKIGYVVFGDDTNIAMGFLRMVEGNGAMIDALCTNPEVSAWNRNGAIDILVTRLIDRAKAMEVTGILSFSKDKNTLDRSEKFGFKKSDETLIALNLGG